MTMKPTKTVECLVRMKQGMLLMGFSKEHGDAARQWMQQMEPGFRVLHCTAAALDGTVEEAVAGTGLEQNGAEEHQQVNDVLPRLVLLSGMSGEEAVAIAENWEEYTGWKLPHGFPCVVQDACTPKLHWSGDMIARPCSGRYVSFTCTHSLLHNS